MNLQVESLKADHPITPPPELVEQWLNSAPVDCVPLSYSYHIATQSARWGADQELEACCEWFKKEGWNSCHPEALRAARRPKPPSLKELALEIVKCYPKALWSEAEVDTIRRALEVLPD